MTPKQINELIGQEVMGWTLRRSKNPRYDWYVDANGHHAGLVRNFNPTGYCYGNGIADCMSAVDKLIEMGYRSFRLIQVWDGGGFDWSAEIQGLWDEEMSKYHHCGGAGATREEAICSMVVKVLEGWP